MIKVCIDPGHGGQDRYNRGPNGYIEADGVLKISRYLKEELEATGQFHVILTRYGDITLSLTQRGTIAVKNKVDLFISEHTNAGPESAGGTDVYYSVDIPADKTFAENLARAVSQALGIRNRGAKTREYQSSGEDYYTVIDTAQDGGVPHVLLIESAFHTNPNEERLLLQDEVLRKIAKAQAAVISNFFGITGVGGVSTGGNPPENPSLPRVLKYTSPIMKGEDVREVQTILKNKGFYTGEIDGSFGPLTDSAVRSFQRSNGLEVDGMVGPKTREKLFATSPVSIPEQSRYLSYKVPTMKGEDVKMVQQRLKDLGFYTGQIDGSFGPLTDTAVRNFQWNRMIQVDGSVGPITWRELFG
jgi:N-acetylmuramoyl-L-alanine amidase